MESNPRGFVLIINNEEFEGSENDSAKREGSENDCESLISIFEQCHFTPEVHRNKSLEVCIRAYVFVLPVKVLEA
jgi:hypothetical protein